MRRTSNGNNDLMNDSTKSRTKKESIEDLVSLSGKIDIDAYWQKDEEEEIKEYTDH